MPLLIQIWMFATPIIYPLSIVPERLRPYYALNPMAGVVDSYRRILLHGQMPDPMALWLAALIAALTLFCGLLYFKKVEFQLADVL